MVGLYLIGEHKRIFSVYWAWLDRAQSHAHLHLQISSVFGFTMHETATTKWRTVMNFPGQANGAEMLRLACIRATERGIVVCAPIHDAVLIEAASDQIDDAVREMQEAMRWASREVLNGFELDSDAKIVRWPERYVDGRGTELWDIATELIKRPRHPDRCQAG